MRQLAGPLIIGGGLLLIAAAVLAGAVLVAVAVRPPAPQEGLTEGQKLLTESAAVAGFLGAALMGWGIVGGLIAARSAERQQQGSGSQAR
jgi:hypothetical protein